MPKVKSKRQKLHKKAAKAACKNSATNFADVDMKDESSVGKTTLSEPLAGGVFSKLNIDLDALQKQLNPDDKDFDGRSGVTSKSLRGLNLKKKDKQKLRHEIWMKKMDIIQTTKKEQKEKKKRQKTAVVGDMRPLEDTLPTLDLLMRTSHYTGSNQSATREVKPKGIKKEKRRQKEMMDDISLFKQVISHPEYQKNPSQTITEHLSNKIKHEVTMDS